LVSHLSGERPLRLEHGEAHIAIRAGAKPSEPDYVVRRFRPIRFGLYCHKECKPNEVVSSERLDGIELIGPTQLDLHQPFARWISALEFPPEFSIKVDSQDLILPMILEKLGAGYIADYQAAPFPQLKELIPPSDSTSIPLWAVVHHDLKRTTKVREFLELLYSLVA
jgi:DNA-binding transcriptional LysR family regulator